MTQDKVLNKRQIPMKNEKRKIYKVLTKKELSTFFSSIDNYKFKTIFMILYGYGLCMLVNYIAHFWIISLYSSKEIN